MKSLRSHTAWIIVMLAIILWTAVVSGWTIHKYNQFGFDAIDLGIYEQVFYQSARGNLFEFTIHPHSYLGDHVELFILPLVPLYMLWPRPEMLLLLQATWLALGAIPLFLLARSLLRMRWALGIVAIYLLYPIFFNIAAFEFHLLPFAIPLLLWLFYVYHTKRLAWFIVLSLLSISVREDVTLVVGMFGILALIDRRSWQWIVAPIIIAGAWFVAAMQITGYFNETGGYKFISLYTYLGETPGEIITTALLKPWLIFKQLFTLNNLLLVLALTLPLAGLPLLQLRYFLPALLIYIQLFLAPFNATILIQTHYTSLLLPFIFIAAVFALSDRNPLSNKVFTTIKKFQPLPTAFVVVAVVYSFLTLSPIQSVFAERSPQDETNATISIKQDIVRGITPTDSVVASFDFLPALANRSRLYSMHYAFLGHKQYSNEVFEIPPPIDSIAYDASDALVYQLQASVIASYGDYYDDGFRRIRDLITANNLHIASVADSVVHLNATPNDIATLTSYDVSVPDDTHMTRLSLADTLTLLGWRAHTDYVPIVPTGQLVPLELYWSPKKPLTTDYALSLSLVDTDTKTIYQKYYPLGYGLWPTREWDPGTTVQTNYWFVIPDAYPLANYQLEIQVVELEGYMTLDGNRSTTLRLTDIVPLGDAILLTTE